MKKYNHQEYLEYLKNRDKEFEKFKIDFAKRRLRNQSLPEKDKKIIEKEKELYEETKWGFLKKIKINKVTQGHTPSKPRRKKGERIRREFRD